MGIFSKRKDQNNLLLTLADFKTEKMDFHVESLKLSTDFFKKFPQAKKKKNYLGTKSLITNTATISIFDREIEVSYSPTEIKLEEEIFIKKMNKTLNWILANKILIYSFLSNQLLKVKNDSWLEKDEEVKSKEDFISQLKLTRISFLNDSSSKLDFDSADLFWGHHIVAHLTAGNKLFKVDIQG